MLVRYGLLIIDRGIEIEVYRGQILYRVAPWPLTGLFGYHAVR